MKVYLTWQFPRNNHPDMSKMGHDSISTLFKNDDIYGKAKKWQSSTHMNQTPED